MPPVSRGFRHLHRAPAGQEDRVPPGQYVTDGFPVLSAGPTPHTPLEQWTFSITQGGQTKKSWTWQEFRALPAENVTTDIHCVTRWSKLDTMWQGVSVDTLLGQVEHDAPYVLAFCDGGYTTNLPIEDLMGGQAWVAYYYDGQPLESEHGGPARLLVPRLLYSARTWPDVIYRGATCPGRPRRPVVPGFGAGHRGRRSGRAGRRRRCGSGRSRRSGTGRGRRGRRP
jgi:DMSO/TMAO reductase YedYZ molybdopterin-dependent catalytic subunit